MALSNYAVRALKIAVGDAGVGQEIATLINTHAAGTLSARAKAFIKTTFGLTADSAPFIAAVEASSALAATDLARLGIAISNRGAASLIAAELIA